MSRPRTPGRPLRLDADPQDVGRGLANLVVVVLELLREVLERQAIRRMDGGELTPEQIDELGRALIEIRGSLEHLRQSLGVTSQEADDMVTRARHLLDRGPGDAAGPAADRPADAGQIGALLADALPSAPARSSSAPLSIDEDLGKKSRAGS